VVMVSVFFVQAPRIKAKIRARIVGLASSFIDVSFRNLISFSGFLSS
jgi:hypothetical protein